MSLIIKWKVGGRSPLRPLLKAATRRWQSVITSNHQLTVALELKSKDGIGGNLATTFIEQLDPITGLPLAARVELDAADANLLQLSRSGRRELTTVLTHELGHALGFGALWQQRGLVDAAGYLGPSALREYQAKGGVGDRIPLEGQGGSGTAGVHWSEVIFGHELMTPDQDQNRSPLSRITVGAIEDLGYGVNWAAAERY